MRLTMQMFVNKIKHYILLHVIVFYLILSIWILEKKNLFYGQNETFYWKTISSCFYLSEISTLERKPEI